MEVAILLSLAASFCTATSSICQRLGARNLELSGFQVRGFDTWLVFRLARQPVWLLGFASMLAGFLLQVSALHFGPLALVQPILAVELLFVFGYLAALTRCRGVRLREWLAAELLGLSVLAAGVWALSRSHLITGAAAARSRGEAGGRADGELARKSR
jgi:hypothetical protein